MGKVRFAAHGKNWSTFISHFGQQVGEGRIQQLQKTMDTQGEKKRAPSTKDGQGWPNLWPGFDALQANLTCQPLLLGASPPHAVQHVHDRLGKQIILTGIIGNSIGLSKIFETGPG
jgi:hypothetical protein